MLLRAAVSHQRRRFRWTADTALNFIYSRKLIPRMRIELERQLKQYEELERKPTERTHVVNAELKTIVWTPEHVRRCISSYSAEEVILANTFLNTYVETGPISDPKKPCGPRLMWNDKQLTGTRTSHFKNKLCTSFVPAYEQMQLSKPLCSAGES